MTSIQRQPLSLPHDLFHSYIIPDILSHHLHLLLVGPRSRGWPAFYILPQVSFAFRATCQALCIGMFGLERDEGGKVIHDILTFAQSLWTQAKRPAHRSRPVPEYTYGQLMSSTSLIQVYMCTALARSFFNLDVLWHMELESKIGELSDDELALADDDDWGGVGDSAPPSRRFRMRDDLMHRVYLPLTCAMKLCDSIRPERVAYIVADYLAGLVPLYSTAPVMLKYTQDLETYVAREHRVDLTWITWTSQTLGLLEGMERLLQQMQSIGKLVKSFAGSSKIPMQVLEGTNIIKVLHDVVVTDWGPHSEEIKERAINLLLDWTPAESAESVSEEISGSPIMCTITM